jgi:hypothetical protein
MTTQFKAHDSYLLKCVLSPNVQHLVTTGSDKTAKVRKQIYNFNARIFENKYGLSLQQMN